MGIRSFIQDEILGMKWLNKLIGMILNACGLDTSGKLGGGVQFFICDVVKIMVLLGVMIFLISYIQSYFPPERTKKILGRFHAVAVLDDNAEKGSTQQNTHRIICGCFFALYAL